jgi:hypothetical protein
MDEMQSLVRAWVDRGVLARDVVPLMATYLCTTSINAKLPLETIMEMIPRVWARSMLVMLEMKLVEPIPEPPSKP